MRKKREFNISFIMWMVLSVVCFSIFKAYLMIEDKELNTILLVGLYMLIGLGAFMRMVDEAVKIDFFEGKLMNIFYILNIIAIPISVFFIDNHPQLTNYLIMQLIILTIFGLMWSLVEALDKKHKRCKKK